MRGTLTPSRLAASATLTFATNTMLEDLLDLCNRVYQTAVKPKALTGTRQLLRAYLLVDT